MRFMRILGFAAAVLAATTAIALAQTKKPSQEEVKNLTLKAAELVAVQGVDAAKEVFNKDGDFKYGEVYVNLIDLGGTWIAYPPRPAAAGQNVLNMKDADGKPMVQDIIKLARDQGEGWLEYRWLNPASNRIEPKITYVKRVPDKDFIVYSGIYKN